jgi:hypothetical protein
VPLVVLAVFVVLACIALIPFSIILRFRRGTVRRPARSWVATLNLITVAISAAVLLAGALIASRWVPEALKYAGWGMAAGCLLGVIGTALVHWDYRGGRLQYLPNRWLVLLITLIVTARVFYGFWRTWEAWRASVENMAWVAASGMAASMSAGSVVLGYYLVFWAGVRRRIAQDRRR